MERFIWTGSCDVSIWRGAERNGKQVIGKRHRIAAEVHGHNDRTLSSAFPLHRAWVISYQIWTGVRDFALFSRHRALWHSSRVEPGGRWRGIFWYRACFLYFWKHITLVSLVWKRALRVRGLQPPRGTKDDKQKIQNTHKAVDKTDWIFKWYHCYDQMLLSRPRVAFTHLLTSAKFFVQRPTWRFQLYFQNHIQRKWILPIFRGQNFVDSPTTTRYTINGRCGCK